MNKLLPIVCLVGVASILRAEIRPNPLFTDNAVLQQGAASPFRSNPD